MPLLLRPIRVRSNGLGVPPDIQAEMESEADEANEFFYSNRAKVFFQFMNPEFVRYAIENGDIEGDSEPRDSICITASQEMLRDFVARPERQVFYVGPGFDEYWIMGFVRLRPAEVRSCGFGKERLSGARPLTDLGYRNGVRKMHMRFRR